VHRNPCIASTASRQPPRLPSPANSPRVSFLRRRPGFPDSSRAAASRPRDAYCLTLLAGSMPHASTAMASLLAVWGVLRTLASKEGRRSLPCLFRARRADLSPPLCLLLSRSVAIVADGAPPAYLHQSSRPPKVPCARASTGCSGAAARFPGTAGSGGDGLGEPAEDMSHPRPSTRGSSILIWTTNSTTRGFQRRLGLRWGRSSWWRDGLPPPPMIPHLRLHPRFPTLQPPRI
jgi:hypothetical protein